MKLFLRIAVAVFLIECFNGQLVNCLAQGNSFTYQGRLNAGGAAANGSYDMAFTLFNTNTSGIAIAGPVTNTSVSVTNGLFTTLVNFGPGVFTGASNWMQIAVSTNAANSFSTLTPRQQLTPTPYAIFADTASNLSGTLPATQLSGTLAAANIGAGTISSVMLAPDAVTMLGTPGNGPTNTVNVSSNGLVGIGLSNNIPAAGLQIANGAAETALSVLYEVESGSGGFTNLNGASSIAATNSLVAVGGANGITLVSITNSSMPVPVSQLVNGVGAFTNISEIEGLVWAGSNLVAASFGSNAVTIIACTNPASPVKLAELDNGVGGWNYLGGVYSVAVSSNLLAIAAVNSSAVTLADISNPRAPVLKSTIINGSFGFTNLGGAISVAISGNVMAVGALNSNAVTLVNISNPANPQKFAEIRNGVGGFTNLTQVGSVALNGNLLAISSLGNSAVTLVDVTTPSSPVLLSQIVDGVGGYSMKNPFNVTLSGSLLAVGTAYTTVSLVNVNNPSSPVLVATATLGLNGADYLNEPSTVAVVGTNLVVGGLGANSLTIFGMGTQSVGLDSANWVGIGTTQPMAPLDVVGNVIIQNATQFDVNATHVAMGGFAAATTTNAVSIGYLTTASGIGSLALGDYTTASGQDSTAMGQGSTASGDYSTAIGYYSIASGPNSTALGQDSFAGGQNSTCMGYESGAGGSVSTAMGFSTDASGDYSTAMGSVTVASANYATAMGELTTASGPNSTAMGYNTTAAGTYSFAAGQQAQALHQGSFVWADSQNATYASTTNDSFNIRAQGGVRLDNSTSIAFGNQTRQMLELYRDPSSIYIYGIGVQNSTFYQRTGTNGGFAWYMGGAHSDLQNNAGGGKTLMTLSTAGLTVNGTFVSASDRNLKENFTPVSGQDVLQKVAAMPVSRWNYINDAGTEHIGPMAQDFYAAFGVGPDDKHITTVDEGGVALAAIQGLNQKLEAENAELKSQNDALAARLNQLETLVKQMAIGRK